jgi:hypothetical protein
MKHHNNQTTEYAICKCLYFLFFHSIPTKNMNYTENRPQMSHDLY